MPEEKDEKKWGDILKDVSGLYESFDIIMSFPDFLDISHFVYSRVENDGRKITVKTVRGSGVRGNGEEHIEFGEEGDSDIKFARLFNTTTEYSPHERPSSLTFRLSVPLKDGYDPISGKVERTELWDGWYKYLVRHTHEEVVEHTKFSNPEHKLTFSAGIPKAIDDPPLGFTVPLVGFLVRISKDPDDTVRAGRDQRETKE